MSIELLAHEYQPGEAARDVVARSNTLLIVGISGAGKDTIQSHLLKKPDYHRITTHTTRAPRYNNGVLEQNGADYYFVSQGEMYELLETKQMIEVNQFGDNFYGTSVAEFERANASQKIAVADIDVHGISAMRDLGGDAIRSLFILPPSYDEWMTRLGQRYPDLDAFHEAFSDRRTTAIDELDHALSVPYYHFIINDELERAVRVVDEIAHRENMFNRHDDEARLVARDILDELKRLS